jgi:hypothetical protein
LKKEYLSALSKKDNFKSIATFQSHTSRAFSINSLAQKYGGFEIISQ